MNIHFQDEIPENFDDSSRVWIYQSNRSFSIHEALEIEERIEKFTACWDSHGAPVTGYGNLFFGHFIILIADERATGVSGCSTDSSVRLIKSLEADYHLNLFDREMLAFIVQERIQLIPLSMLEESIQNNMITPDTLYFNNTVQTKAELLKQWIIPVKESWLAKRYNLV